MPLVSFTNGDNNRQDSVVSASKEEKESQREFTKPQDGYWGRRCWDPSVTWTAAEEARVVRKTDLHLLAFFCIVTIAILIDRGVIYNALTDDFLVDSGLTRQDYKLGLQISRLGVLIAQYPLQLVVNRFGFKHTFSPLLLCWGVIAACQTMINGRAAFIATRFFIGIVEGGYGPGMCGFFTQFYQHSELTLRLAILNAAGDFSKILAALIAAGILKADGIAGRPGWFWLFIFEGVATFIVGIFCYLYLPRSPAATASAIHRKSWYTEREELIVVNRILREDPTKGHPGKATYKDVLATLADQGLWGLYATAFLGVISFRPVVIYLSLTLKKMGFSTFDSYLLQVPYAGLNMVLGIAVSWSSQHFKERAWHCVLAHASAIPFLISLDSLPPSTGLWERYGCTLLIVGAPSYYPIVLSWISESSFSTRKRMIAICTYGVLVALGAIVSAQVYQESDAPHFHKGHKALIACAVLTCLLFVLHRMNLARINKARSREWDTMSAKEQIEYQHATVRMALDGNKRLDFHFPL